MSGQRKVIIAGACVFLVILILVGIREFDRFLLSAYESSAVGSLHVINFANADFAKDHPDQGYAATLKELEGRRDADDGSKHTIDAKLADGQVNGYVFRYVPQRKTGRKIDGYELFAEPVKPGKPGQWHFFSDETGVIRGSEIGPANQSSQPLN